MKDIICATFDSNLIFEKGEKVIAFNWFEKCAPYRFGTFIKKYDPSDELQEEENCRKIETQDMKLYNIGTYKVRSAGSCSAYIVEFSHDDCEKERKNANKRVG